MKNIDKIARLEYMEAIADSINNKKGRKLVKKVTKNIMKNNYVYSVMAEDNLVVVAIRTKKSGAIVTFGGDLELLGVSPEETANTIVKCLTMDIKIEEVILEELLLEIKEEVVASLIDQYGNPDCDCCDCEYNYEDDCNYDGIGCCYNDDNYDDDDDDDDDYENDCDCCCCCCCEEEYSEEELKSFDSITKALANIPDALLEAIIMDALGTEQN